MTWEKDVFAELSKFSQCEGLRGVEEERDATRIVAVFLRGNRFEEVAESYDASDTPATVAARIAGARVFRTE